MSQIEIAQIIEQIKQEITVDSNGQGRASIRATARLADINDAGLLRSLKTAADNSHSKMVEKLIRKGFEGADILGWSQSGIPDIAVATILHYYGYEAGKRCSEQARLACEAFESIGVRAWMQDIIGWTKTPTQQPQSPEPTPALPPVEQRLNMKVLVQIVEKVYQEAHIDIPDGLTEAAIRQVITDRYNSGEMTPDLNIFQVDFESISATIVQQTQEAA